jgi:hypothetical protein
MVLNRCVDSQPGGADGCFVVHPGADEVAFMTTKVRTCGAPAPPTSVPGNPSEGTRILGMDPNDAIRGCAPFEGQGVLYEACITSYCFGSRATAVASTTEVCHVICGVHA